MALNGDVLGTQLLAAIDLAVLDYREVGTAQRQQIWKAIGNAIVTHIQSNGQVVVASVGGVTVGAGTSGPGTGTIV